MKRVAPQSLPSRSPSPPDSSPLAAHRSAITNDPMTSRANARTPHGRRIRDLFRGLLNELGPGPHSVPVQADALELAELTAIYEDYRAALAGNVLKADEANALTRLSSTVARARRNLLKTVPAKPKGNALAEYLAQKKAAQNA